MIDLHCHLLPGVDDGSKTIEQSVRVLQAMKEVGVTGVCLTPHHTVGRIPRGLPPSDIPGSLRFSQEKFFFC